MQIESGASDVIIAGGVESMSNAVHYSTKVRHGARLGDVTLYDSLTRARATAGGKSHPVPGGMIETAENLRREYQIPRQEQDEFSLRSHQRAVAAQEKGLFDEEIVPFTVHGRKGDTVVSADEHPRPDTTLESLATLRPVMLRQDADSTVTAGNSSGQNDGASDHLIGVLRIDAQTNRKVDRLVKLGKLRLLDEPDRLTDRVFLRAIEQLFCFRAIL